MYELSRKHTETKSAHIRPFDPERGFTRDPMCPATKKPPQELSLTGWRLAHAVKKADCLNRRPHAMVARLGLLLEQLSTFDWRKGNLRLLPGAASAYADFVSSSFAGRIAQGIALLTMEAREYEFVGHYQRPSGKPGPDFVVQMRNSVASRALVESKGSFVKPGQQPDINIKGILREGLDQLVGATFPGASKSFVVGTFLRESADVHQEPSLVALVDPDGDAESGHSSSSSDWILRQNYAAWLDAMGFHYAASDLRSSSVRDSSETVLLHAVKLGQTEFGVVVLGYSLPDLARPRHQLVPWRGEMCLVAGLPIIVLRAVEATLADPAIPLEVGADGERLDSRATQGPDNHFKGSILSDGSLFGALPIGELLALTPHEVRL